MALNSQIIFRDTDYKYGFHVHKFRTLVETVNSVVESTPFTTMQTYISNGRSYEQPKCEIEDIISAREILQENDVRIYIHACLMYNLCGAANHRKEPKFETMLTKTCDGLVTELDITAGLGGGVVVHPNSCHDKKKGIFTIIKTIEHVLTKNTVNSGKLAKSLGISTAKFKKQRLLILENSAQEGSKRGGTLEELAEMVHGVREDLRPQVKVCIDTAHAFGAGIYDWGLPSEVCRFYDDFDRIIGLEYLEMFHLNDSRCSNKKADNAFFGSKKDRHENLLLGYIFGDECGGETEEGSRINGLKEFFSQAYNRGISIIGEPPASTKEGSVGPGGARDWGVVCKILEDGDFPLEEIYNF